MISEIVLFSLIYFTFLSVIGALVYALFSYIMMPFILISGVSQALISILVQIISTLGRTQLFQLVILPPYFLFAIIGQEVLTIYYTFVDPIITNSYLKLFFLIECAFLLITAIVIVYYVVSVIRSLNILYRMVKDSEKMKDIEEQCSICLMNLLQPFEEVEAFQCKHVFHNSCITKWIKINQSQKSCCPMCRQPLAQSILPGYFQ